MPIVSKDTYFLDPGFIYFSTKPHTMQTVLGNSVSVCLWDKKLKYGAMNHFIYPVVRKSKDATSQYGNVATLTIIKMMEEAGCTRKEMVAHILGGAYSEGKNSAPKVSRENIDVARRVLLHKGIKIISEDVEGTMGRKVVFDTETGHVAVLKVHALREEDWVTEKG